MPYSQIYGFIPPAGGINTERTPYPRKFSMDGNMPIDATMILDIEELTEDSVNDTNEDAPDSDENATFVKCSIVNNQPVFNRCVTPYEGGVAAEKIASSVQLVFNIPTYR